MADRLVALRRDHGIELDRASLRSVDVRRGEHRVADPAPAWGTGDNGTYAVYRETAPGFTPGPANRVALGVAGTSWTHGTAPADLNMYYAVRAENDENCSDGQVWYYGVTAVSACGAESAD